MRQAASYLRAGFFPQLVCFAALTLAAIPALLRAEESKPPVFRAGAFAIDISPRQFPVIVNGGMTERTANKLEDPLHARCLVLDDGRVQLALVIVDSCMLPRDLLDRAKALAEKKTGLSANRMLISATHTHSAPSAMGCLGSDADLAYVDYLPGRIAEGIAEARQRLQPARIGWAVGRDEKNVACRHWVMQPGAAQGNPFGGTKDDVVTMHPGYDNPKKIRPTGPPDPEVPVLSLTTMAGQPFAVLTNYSLHYVGAPAVSADYFALVCSEMSRLLGDTPPEFMAAHSNGTSGDMWLMDYTRPRRTFDRHSVAKDVAAAAYAAYRQVQYFDWVPLVMEESTLSLGIRQPAPEELAAAREAVAAFEGRKPKTVPEVYARETVLLAEGPQTRELKLQAIRLGDLGIAAIPNEVYASTGLFIKKQSPLKTTFTIELANGAEGYIPPEELHKLGGYTTWRARTSCLQLDAEAQIRNRVVELLHRVAQSRADEAPVPSKP